MSLRVVGPRVLLKPIQQAQRSELIHLTDTEPPTVGEVVGVGSAVCSDCGARHQPEFKVGDVVMIPATAGTEITVDGEALWVVPITAVLSYWKPEPTRNEAVLAAIARGDSYVMFSEDANV